MEQSQRSLYLHNTRKTNTQKTRDKIQAFTGDFFRGFFYFFRSVIFISCISSYPLSSCHLFLYNSYARTHAHAHTHKHPCPRHDFFFLYSRVLCVLHPYLVSSLNCFAFCFCLYLQHTTQTSMPPAGFEPAIPTSDRPQTLTLDSSATGIGNILQLQRTLVYFFNVLSCK